ncbi:hypothetical protein G6F68_015906 [Rhizopus microsporus]|nr:hypothetical protein G6F68_015906 [Rhizopus microsporus]
MNYLQEDFPNDIQLTEKNVCVGKEWYRFPSQFFLPSDTRLQFIKSDFHGQLPKTFEEDITVGQYEIDGEEKYYRRRHYGWFGARQAPQGFNDINMEDPSVYVDENEYTDHWEVLACYPFLDTENSHRLSRAFWVPGSPGLAWGDYCMLKRKH